MVVVVVYRDPPIEISILLKKRAVLPPPLSFGLQKPSVQAKSATRRGRISLPFAVYVYIYKCIYVYMLYVYTRTRIYQNWKRGSHIYMRVSVYLVKSAERSTTASRAEISLRPRKITSAPPWNSIVLQRKERRGNVMTRPNEKSLMNANAKSSSPPLIRRFRFQNA